MCSLVVRSFVVCAALLSACSDRDPPKPCETASDCGPNQSCLRELATLSPAAAEAQLKRAPKELCVPNKSAPTFTGFSNDGKLYAGAAKIDVTPRGFETHNNIDDPQRCPHNKSYLFDGYIDAPRDQNDPKGDINNPCLERFNDTH